MNIPLDPVPPIASLGREFALILSFLDLVKHLSTEMR